MADIPANITTTAVLETAPGTAGGSFSGKLEFAGDTDWVKVHLEAGKAYTILGSSDVLGSSDQSVMNIYDAKGNLLGTQSGFPDFPSPHFSFFTVDKTQDVFVEIKSLVAQPGEFGLFVSDVSDSFAFFFDNNANTSFTGTADAARVVGGAGNDFLNVGAGLDAFGEQGNDFINGNDVSNRISGGIGDDQIFAGLGNDFVWGDAGDDFLEGNAGNDVVFGGSGDDRLLGLQDNDTLVGGEGADELNGGDGNDTADYTQSRSGVSVDLAANTGISGDASGDTFFSVENVTGSQVADIISGDNSTNTLKGLGGNDIMAGRGGADTIDGGAASDTVTYKDSATGVTINLATGTAAGGDAQGDKLISIENLTGSGKVDVLTGNAAANILQGLAGADTLNGGGGSDTASYSNSIGGVGVTINLATGTASGADAQGDKLVSIENLTGTVVGDTLTGSNAANVLDGASGNDTLSGGAGADRLIGGGGKDTLTGGANNDVFDFNFTGDSPVGANRDRITDFSHAQGDKLDLSGIDANPTPTGDQALTFIGKAAFTAVGQVRFFTEGDHTVVEVNNNGTGGAEMQIELAGNVNLVAGDFVL